MAFSTTDAQTALGTGWPDLATLDLDALGIEYGATVYGAGATMEATEVAEVHVPARFTITGSPGNRVIAGTPDTRTITGWLS